MHFINLSGYLAASVQIKPVVYSLTYHLDLPSVLTVTSTLGDPIPPLPSVCCQWHCSSQDNPPFSMSLLTICCQVMRGRPRLLLSSGTHCNTCLAIPTSLNQPYQSTFLDWQLQLLLAIVSTRIHVLSLRTISFHNIFSRAYPSQPFVVCSFQSSILWV